MLLLTEMLVVIFQIIEQRNYILKFSYHILFLYQKRLRADPSLQ